MMKNKNVLVTGATGSFGKSMVERLLNDDQVNKVIVFSRDELKQFEMQSKLKSDKLRYFLGDVRDYERLKQATYGVDVIIHAAAIKQIPAAEYNPMETIKTNIIGAENIVNVAIENSVSKVIALSTDKAANPANLYGATKLCSDKLMIAGNVLSGARSTRFSVVRYGNVMGSRGSVIPFFIDKAKSGILPITDMAMTRFNISLEDGIEMVFWALQHAIGGEILVPKIPSYRIGDVAEAIGPNCKHEVVGIRLGEKLHEEMITSSDSPSTIDLGKYYAILGAGLQDNISKYKSAKNANSVPTGFAYESGSNPEFLSVEQIRTLIKTHLDPEFKPV